MSGVTGSRHPGRAPAERVDADRGRYKTTDHKRGAEDDAVQHHRETVQPIREKTGGSTFKNPPGESAWKMVDAAGWRGKPYGGAMFSPLHANFLINTGSATAADLEGLGDTVRAEVKAKLEVTLEWEVKRIGRT